ncbi:MAG: cell envelope integrity EipB family protein, partial [Alphaproteobacteria bacterium]|nr:cell envelope integrity EipB family protein [Alphaproteobacteria bacterium]
GPDPIWPMQLAFFAAEGEAQPGEEMPDFEMTMHIQPNGVVTSMVLNFGDFTVNGVLEKLEELPASGC